MSTYKDVNQGLAKSPSTQVFGNDDDRVLVQRGGNPQTVTISADLFAQWIASTIGVGINVKGITDLADETTAVQFADYGLAVPFNSADDYILQITVIPAQGESVATLAPIIKRVDGFDITITNPCTINWKAEAI